MSRFEIHEAGFSAVMARAQAEIFQEPGKKEENEKEGKEEKEGDTEKEDKDDEGPEVVESWFLVAGSSLVTPEGEVKLLWH